MKSMIKTALYTIAIAAITSFFNVAQAQKRYDRPTDIVTSETGFNMKAKINNKIWQAKVMMPDFGSEKGQMCVSAQNDEKFIGFMIPSSKLKAGNKMTYDKFQIYEMGGGQPGVFYTCGAGTIEITKNDGKWLEGKFHFPATSTKQKLQINGTFRVASSPVKH